MSTRDAVLSALREAGETGVSGQVLAARLGVSRVAISKHVSALQDDGYEIDAVRGTGYRLVAVPLIAIPQEVRPLVRHPLWVSIEGSTETTSTNDDARARARAGAEQGTVVVAARQSAGRGRLGRHWSSPDGGAYVSVVLRPSAAPVEVAPLSLVVAVGIARGLESLGVTARLKWPNDVWIGERKVAGVLLEMSAEGDSVSWVVAGFGLNVVRTPDALESAAYLSDVLPGVTPAQAAAAALDGVAAAYVEWCASGFAELAAQFEARSVLAGREVTVSDGNGAMIAHGRVDGVDAEGRLLVFGSDGRSAVAAGDVTLRPARA